VSRDGGVVGPAARWSALEAAGLALGAVAAALVFTWPLAAHPFGRLAAPIGPGDPYLNLWILGWDLGAISHDPLSLVTGRVFDANIFFPAGGTLAYSDHMILQAIALWPLYAVTGSLAACYNALLFLSLAGSVAAMYVFARSVTGSRSGAAVAGVAWGFMPFRFAHLLHLQLQSLYLLPLAFLALHRLMAGRRRRDALGLGAVAALQAISSAYWGVVGALALVAGAVALAVGIGRWRSAVVARRLALAGVVGAILVAPFAWPYVQVQRREGFARNLFEASQHAAVVRSYLRVPPGNLIYGRTGLLRAPRAGPAGPSRSEGPEQELFPGFVLVALAVVGAWRGGVRDSRPVVGAMLAVIVLGGVLSLGPDGFRWLYSTLHRVVFGFQAVRAPARFGVLVTFGLAGLAALGVRELTAGRATAPGRGRADAARRRSVAAALVALVSLEYVNVPLPTVAAPPASTPVGRWLARTPGPGAVLYLPLDDDLGNTAAMVDSLSHRRPIVNGYSGQRPAFFMGLVDTLNQAPSADALWTLRDLNVRFVVSPTRLASAAPLVERARLDGGVVYELVWTAESEAAVPRPEVAPPPDPGALPFANEERAVYRLLWQSGGVMGLAAGRATITAGPVTAADLSPAEERATRQLGVEIETASWVARFFEARDRIETWTDAGLLPLRQDQHLREGRRVVDRTTRFDAAARTVKVGEGPPLPLPRGARDGLSAFFYARALPLAPGFTARFPVSEGGRTYVVDLAVEGLEPVTLGGRRVEAYRVVPRLTSASDRRKAIQMMLWISADARRVPLALEIQTGFGSFRAELEAHQAR
jgi:hypothetical protein